MHLSDSNIVVKRLTVSGNLLRLDTNTRLSLSILSACGLVYTIIFCADKDHHSLEQ